MPTDTLRVIVVQIPALNSKGLRLRDLREGAWPGVQIPALNSKGLRLTAAMIAGVRIGSNTSPEFKGIKTFRIR